MISLRINDEIISINFPKALKVIRLFHSGNHSLPPINHPDWIDAEHHTPTKGDMCWIKNNEFIVKAIYYVLPMFNIPIWVDAIEDILLEKPTHWMRLSKSV